MKKGLFVLCFVFVCGAAHAAEWVQYAAGEEFALYYDKSSLVTTDEYNQRMSIRTVYRTPKKHPNKSASVRSLISVSEISCPKKQYRALELTLFLTDGTTDTGPTNAQWHNITPEMPVNKLYKMICNRP